MFDWMVKLIPNEYKWSVAIKKATWTVAKTGVSLLAATQIGKQVSPENWATVTEVSAALLAGCLKIVHDWAKTQVAQRDLAVIST